jgi:DNA-binding beta-propeller fold protein YncE
MEILDSVQENGHLMVRTMKLGLSDALAVASSPTGDVFAISGSMVYLLDLKRGTSVLYVGGKQGSERVGHRLQVQLSHPLGIGVSVDCTLYVTTSGDHCVYEVKDDQMTLFAGSDRGYADGPRLQALFHTPHRIDFLNGEAFIPDCWNHCIRRIGRDGMVTTIAKQTVGFRAGPFSECSVGYPRGLAVGINNDIYISTTGPHYVSRLDMVAETLSHVAGSEEIFRDGPGKSCGFKFPFDVAVHPTTGDIYVADDDNFRIRRVDAQTHEVTTLVGRSPTSSEARDGDLKTARAYAPTGICFSWQGDLVWSERDGRVRWIQNFAPPRHLPRDYLPSFSAYLSDGRYSTSRMNHPDLGEVHLHANILELWGLTSDHLTAVLLSESCAKVPQSSIRRLLELLYAEVQGEPEPIDDAEMARQKQVLHVTESLEVAYLASLLFGKDANNSIMSWALQQASFHSFTNEELAILAFKHLQMCSNSTDYRTVELIAHAVKTRTDSDGPKMQALIDTVTSLEIRDALHSALNTSRLNKAPDDTHSKEANKKQLKRFKLQGPLEDFTKKMKEKSFRIAAATSSPQNAPNGLFTIAISDNPNFGMIADEWVLAARWKYFAFLLEAGLSEIANRKVELPSEMPEGVVRLLIPYLYANKVCKGWAQSLTKQELADSCRFILSNALLFRITSLSDEGTEIPLPGFSPLLSYCQSIINKDENEA